METKADVEIIPAILVKDRQELLHRIELVRPFVKRIQIDIMDGVFVPNKTIGLEDIEDLPSGKYEYEFHWMVKNPKEGIFHTPGAHIHLVHIEVINSETEFRELLKLARRVGGELGLAINPETPIKRILPFVSSIKQVLVMTVHPGFSGQNYILQAEEKIRKLRKQFPNLDIEVDGGINLSTIHRAYLSGANLIAAASAVFNSSNIKDTLSILKKTALTG